MKINVLKMEGVNGHNLNFMDFTSENQAESYQLKEIQIALQAAEIVSPGGPVPGTAGKNEVSLLRVFLVGK